MGNGGGGYAITSVGGGPLSVTLPPGVQNLRIQLSAGGGMSLQEFSRHSILQAFPFELSTAPVPKCLIKAAQIGEETRTVVIPQDEPMQWPKFEPTETPVPDREVTRPAEEPTRR